jgi:hypothetical protein
MEKVLFSMMEDNRFTQAFSSIAPKVSKSMEASVVVVFIQSFFMQLGFSYFWGLINTLQLILYMPLLKVHMPKNVKLFYGILLPIANFELIPPEYSTELVLDISSSEDEPYSDVLEEMGYETHNSLLNMGSLFVYFCAFTVGLALMIILKALNTVFPSEIGSKLYFKLKDTIFWGSFLLLFTESYIEILISGYLNTQSKVNYTGSDVFSTITAYFMIVIQLVVVPAAFIYMLKKPHEQLLSTETQLRIGVLYADIKT